MAALIRQGPSFMTRLAELVEEDARLADDVGTVLDALMKLAEAPHQEP
ncbi:hypothetical protein SAMN05444161_3145 [Rhizobiales bacterium GAS191]|nr:hypothetical protein SAMN05444161_3145 [Rhizobiales bacterium GAS191]